MRMSYFLAGSHCMCLMKSFDALISKCRPGCARQRHRPHLQRATERSSRTEWEIWLERSGFNFDFSSNKYSNHAGIRTRSKMLLVFRFDAVLSQHVCEACGQLLLKRSIYQGRCQHTNNSRLKTFYIYFTVATIHTLSLNSRRHVVAMLSTRGEGARFKMGVTLGVILIRSLVYTKHIPGRLRSGSGVALE